MAWRMHTLIWAAQRAIKLDGDFVECGTFRGFKSYFLAKYFEDEMKEKSLWLYDTFEGQPDNFDFESPIHKNEHNKPNLFEFVKERFQTIPFVKIVKGVVPEILSKHSPEKVSFLHLDMNSAVAEIGALDYFFDKMPPGASIVLDDFGHSVFSKQCEAEIKWFENKNHSILELPTGQGLIVK